MANNTITSEDAIVKQEQNVIEEKILLSRIRNGRTEYYMWRKKINNIYGWYELNHCETTDVNINGQCNHCQQLITEFEQNNAKMASSDTKVADNEKSSSQLATKESPKQSLDECVVKSENCDGVSDDISGGVRANGIRSLRKTPNQRIIFQASSKEPPKKLLDISVKSDKCERIDTNQYAFDRGFKVEKIVDGIDKSGEIMFLVKYNNGFEELVPKNVAKAKFPALVINFFEQRIRFYDSDDTEAAGDKK